jgi:hypothetical protein
VRFSFWHKPKPIVASITVNVADLKDKNAIAEAVRDELKKLQRVGPSGIGLS